MTDNGGKVDSKDPQTKPLGEDNTSVLLILVLEKNSRKWYHKRVQEKERIKSFGSLHTHVQAVPAEGYIVLLDHID